MSGAFGLVTCRTFKCQHKVRRNFQRPADARGARGQQLADGERCYRCRKRLARAKWRGVEA